MNMKLVSVLILFFTTLSVRAQISSIDLNQSILHFQQGRQLLESSSYRGAVEMFTQAIGLNGRNADFYMSRGEAFSKLNITDSALQDVKKAMELTPGESNIHFLYANIYFKRRQYSDAIVHYTKAIANSESSKLKVNLAHCYFNRGNSHLALAEFTKALQDFNAAVKKEPRFAEALHNRGYVKIKINDKPGACSDFQMAMDAGSGKSGSYIAKYCH